MPVFDFHCHPSFKTFLGGAESNCWTNVQFDPIDKIVPIFDSQSSLSQLKEGGSNLFVGVLYGLERPFARNFLIRLVALFSGKNVSKDLLNKVRDEEMGFHEYILQELHHLEQSPGIKIIKSIQEYNPADTDTLHIILGVEGGHCFYDTPNNGVQENADVILQQLGAFKQEHRPLYVTLVHMVQNVFANHAYGMKLIEDPVFTPVGNGLTPFGTKFIKAVLKNTDGEKRSLIDIKHLSIRARQEYYKLLEHEFTGQNIPIIASHMGVTGGSWTDTVVKRWCTDPQELRGDFVAIEYGEKLGIKHEGTQTAFNQWSINLNDEDIKAIAKSGGLIGLSMDQRILGWGEIGVEKMSREELEELNADKQRLPINGAIHDCDNWKDPKEQFPRKRRRKEQFDGTVHAKYLCNNILHIVKTAKQAEKTDKEAWQMVCIGSDFDGLIDAVNCCLDANAYQTELRNHLKTYLPPMAAKKGVVIPDLDEVVEGFMFNNAFTFLQKHFV